MANRNVPSIKFLSFFLLYPNNQAAMHLDVLIWNSF